MKKSYDLSQLAWTLSGHTPYLWIFEKTYAMGATKTVEVKPVPAKVPGSVQGALLDARIIPDWNIGLNSRECEWIEHRHWIYRTQIPNEWLQGPKSYRLECLGLDYSGWVFFNEQQIAEFKGSHIPHIFELTENVKDTDNVLEIVFDIPPRWIGQFGYTSKMTEWKPRYNYTWDWVPRIVQIGISDKIALVAHYENEISDISCTADADVTNQTGILKLKGTVKGDDGSAIKVTLNADGKSIIHRDLDIRTFEEGIQFDSLPIELWYPNLEGDQPLYDLNIELIGAEGEILDNTSYRVGFKNITWEKCKGAPDEADSWVCVVNGHPVFLQGVNFAPLRANFADLTYDDYLKRLRVYKDIGVNMLRLNACGFLESKTFYDICDELGIMVWQEFPLTSSGMENWPPEHEKCIEEMEAIARSFIKRRRHHVSLALWCGGNELMGDAEGRKTGMGRPCGMSHPMLKQLGEVVNEMDPDRRFIPASPSGPRAGADPAEFGKGVHWDVHGPYIGALDLSGWEEYWAKDDALFRSELCAAGASPIECIRRYIGEFQEFPPVGDNPYWGRPTHWWIDWSIITANLGREPADLEEYVYLSQKRQADALSIAMKSCKERFPGIGGVLLWTGHDTFPIPINTSIVDFHGNPKPAALALANIWRGSK